MHTNQARKKIELGNKRGEHIYNIWKQSFLHQSIRTCTNSGQRRAPTARWWAPHHRSGSHSWGRPCMDESHASTPNRRWSCHLPGELPLSHTERDRRQQKKCFKVFHHIFKLIDITVYVCVCSDVYVSISVFTSSSDHQQQSQQTHGVRWMIRRHLDTPRLIFISQQPRFASARPPPRPPLPLPVDPMCPQSLGNPDLLSYHAHIFLFVHFCPFVAHPPWLCHLCTFFKNMHQGLHTFNTCLWFSHGSLIVGWLHQTIILSTSA